MSMLPLENQKDLREMIFNMLHDLTFDTLKEIKNEIQQETKGELTLLNIYNKSSRWSIFLHEESLTLVIRI